MADDSTIKESDLISPDGSIEKLIKELEGLTSTYTSMMEVIKKSAKDIAGSLKGASGATKEGKTAIDEATKAANRLEAAQKELVFSTSEIGKEVARLKAQTRDNNALTVEQMRAAKELAGSYAALKRQLSDSITAWKSMDEATRRGTAGRDALNNIINLKQQLTALDKELKLHTASLTENERAQAKLDFLRTDEGKQLMATRREMAELTKAEREAAIKAKELAGSYAALKRQLSDSITAWKSMDEATRRGTAGRDALNNIINLKKQLAALDEELKVNKATRSELAKAIERFNFLHTDEGKQLVRTRQEIALLTKSIQRNAAARARLTSVGSEERRELFNLEQQHKEQVRIMKLEETIANSEVGSYKQLAAQYELNKIKLENMSRATLAQKAAATALEKETLNLYNRMRAMQERIGSNTHVLSDYNKVWGGLGYSVSQVVRELPTLAVSTNHFFLAISNNIPIVIDELKRLKIQNQQLRAEGKPTQSAIKTIVGALFNWQTGLIILMSMMAMHGKAIIAWCKDVANGTLGIMTLNKALDNLSESIKKNNGNYGEQRTTLQLLARRWKDLNGNMQKQKQFIKDNAEEFKKLGVSINKITDAENLLVQNTETFIRALGVRAKAAAAMQLAADEYRTALKKQVEYENRVSDQQNTQSAKERAKMDAFLQTPQGKQMTADYEEKRRVRRQQMTDEQVMAEILAEHAEDIRQANLEYAKTATWLDYLKAGFTYLTSSSESWEQHLGAQARRSTQALKAESIEAEKAGDMYVNLAEEFEAEWRNILKDLGLEEFHKQTTTKLKDLTDIILKNNLALWKKYRASQLKLIQDEYHQQAQAVWDSVDNETEALLVKRDKNEDYLNDISGKYKKLTDEQRQMLIEQNEIIDKTINNLALAAGIETSKIYTEQKIKSLHIIRETLSEQEGFVEKSINDEKDLRLKQLDDEEKLLKESNKTAGVYMREEAEITAEFAAKRRNIIAEYEAQIIKLKQQSIDAQVELARKGSQQELNLLLEQNELAMQLALAENRMRPAAERQKEDEIKALYNKYARDIIGDFNITNLEQLQALEKAKFDIVKHNTRDTNKFQLEQEKELWIAKIEQAEAGNLDWSKAQIDAAKATVEGINRQLKELTGFEGFMGSVSEHGLSGALLERLGFDDEFISGMNDIVNKTLENIQAIIDAEVKLAESAVAVAEARVEAAQSTYEAEVEARNNGYANNVASAKKELELEKKNQKEKERLLVEAQKRQEELNTATQVSSLITASANLWSSLSGIPVIGYALALAAITGMWASFAAAKVKARQVTAQVQEYGEGGLEFLEGGSHASGNDIDLQATNSKGRNMRAEGGEAMAIINKKQTKHYKHVLPGIISSLNKGTFEDKYLSAFTGATDFNIIAKSNSANIDLTKLENEVSNIRKQNDTRYYIMPNGDIVIINKNVKRIIKN